MRHVTPEEFDAVLADIRLNSKHSQELTEEYLLANAILTANRLKIEIDKLKAALKGKHTIDSNDMLIVSTMLKQMCNDVEDIGLRYFVK